MTELDRHLLGTASSDEQLSLLEVLVASERGEPAARRQRLQGWAISPERLLNELRRAPGFVALSRAPEAPVAAMAQFVFGGLRPGRLGRAVVRAWLRGVAEGRPDLEPVLGRGVDRDRLGRRVTESVDGHLRRWVQGGRRSALQHAARRIRPPHPAPGLDAAARGTLGPSASTPYDLILVPGFTPALQTGPTGRAHPTAVARIREAKQAFDEGMAPRILLSGGNVHPPGTPDFEALLMHRAALELGLPHDALLIEPRARHSTTNVRNAGRLMQKHGLRRALITTSPGQDFYFSAAWISDFHGRCQRELGYLVGELTDVGADAWRSAYRPSPEVHQVQWTDPLDP